MILVEDLSELRNFDPVAEVAIALIRSGNQILLLQRSSESHHGGLWALPGGKLELGETAQEAIERELLEEIGCQLQPTLLTLRYARNGPIDCVAHLFDLQLDEPCEITLNEEHQAYQWTNQWESLDLMPGEAEVIRLIQRL